MNCIIRETAEKIMGRSLSSEDGLVVEHINAAEKRLGLKLPEALREFYLAIGNVSCFIKSSVRLLGPEELKCIDDKFVFAMKQGDSCCWGMNTNERYNKDAPVYMGIIEDGRINWFICDIGFTEFICIIMYYQCAQGSLEKNEYKDGYSYCGSLRIIKNASSTEKLMENLSDEWEKVVDRGRLHIYWNEGKIVWYFSDVYGRPDDIMLLCSQKEEDLQYMIGKYGFERMQ